MFDINTIPMERKFDGTTGMTVIRVNPKDMYPAVIARILEVLEQGANPSELLASSERGGSARADILVSNARKLPKEAWEDALAPRSEFSELGYHLFVEKNGGINEVTMKALSGKNRADVMRMVQRGFALEIAYGWFCQAIRLEYGAYDLTITRDENFRL